MSARVRIIMSPENHALLARGELREMRALDFLPDVELQVSRFCPTWGPNPPWWRRFFLGAKRERVIYRITTEEMRDRFADLRRP